jgi:hypothetical protein
MRTVLLFALTGCSFVATEAPRPAPGPTACNRDSQPIVADVAASLGALLAVGVASLDHGGRSDVLVPLSFAGVFGASSVYGAVTVHDCRVEHEKRPAWSLAEMPAVM